MRLLPVDRERAEATIVALQLPVWSVLGAVAWETGGIVTDHGWLRLFGGGGPWMAADLCSYNGIAPRPSFERTAGVHVVAVDVVGGGFVLNRGRLPGPTGRIFYLAPDTFEWIPLHMGYGGFFEWAIGRPRAYERFYAPLRWPTWRSDIRSLRADQGIDRAAVIWRAARTAPSRATIADLWARTLTTRLLILDDEGAAARMTGVDRATRRRRSAWRRLLDRTLGRRG